MLIINKLQHCPTFAENAIICLRKHIYTPSTSSIFILVLVVGKCFILVV